MRNIKRRGLIVLQACVRNSIALALSQFTWLLIFALGSAALIAFGIFVLFGFGWSMISLGCFSFLFAAVIFKGITNG